MGIGPLPADGSSDLNVSGDITVPTDVSGFYILSKNGVQTITIPAPKGAGIELTFCGQRAQDHVLTFTGATLRTGTASSATTATFATSATNLGTSLSVISYNGLWYVISSSGTINYA